MESMEVASLVAMVGTMVGMRSMTRSPTPSNMLLLTAILELGLTRERVLMVPATARAITLSTFLMVVSRGSATTPMTWRDMWLRSPMMVTMLAMVVILLPMLLLVMEVMLVDMLVDTPVDMPVDIPVDMLVMLVDMGLMVASLVDMVAT